MTCINCEHFGFFGTNNSWEFLCSENKFELNNKNFSSKYLDNYYLIKILNMADCCTRFKDNNIEIIGVANV